MPLRLPHAPQLARPLKAVRQHTANAPKPKAVAAKAPTVPTGFRTATIKSRLPKPPSTGALQQGQVKKVEDITSGNNVLTQKLRDLVNDPSPPPTTTLSGGGTRGSGKSFNEIRCQTGCNQGCGLGGCGPKKSPRLQFGVNNGSNNVDFTLTFKLPATFKTNETATLQVGGASHHEGCDTIGYKGYIGINGGKHGFEIESGKEKSYLGLFGTCPDKTDLVPGQQYTLRMTKKTVNGGVQLNTWVNGKPYCYAIDKPGILTRSGVNEKCEPVDQLRIDSWPDTDTSNAISVSSPYLE